MSASATRSLFERIVAKETAHEGYDGCCGRVGSVRRRPSRSTTRELKAALDQAMRTIQDLQARVKALEQQKRQGACSGGALRRLPPGGAAACAGGGTGRERARRARRMLARRVPRSTAR